MKFGIRKPSLKKSLKARTTGKLKRSVKKALIPGYGKKGMGWIKNPKKAAYNKVYNKTSVSLFPAGTSSGKTNRKRTTNTASAKKSPFQNNQFESQAYSYIEGETEAVKVCKFCGADNQDSAAVCSSCGGNEFKHKCGNCGTVFEEGNFCPRCGVKAGAKAKKCPNCGAGYFSAACPDCGYTNKTGNTTVVYANTATQPVKKRETWLWVLGWIFIFPIPLTILMVRNQRLNKWVKIGIIAVAWILYLIIAFTGGGTTNNQEITESSQQQEVVSSTEKETENTSSNSGETPAPTKESTIEDLVNGYNASADNKLVFVEDFVVSSKDSGHYRTEFRLTAYNDAVGKSYKLGDQIVDIISTQSIFGDIDVRIYTDGATLDQCKELIQYASQLLDPTMTDATVKETVDYISEKKEANGYYYGELGLLLLGSEAKGYDLMISTD